METSGAVPPVHLERDPLRGAASSGGGMPPPKRRGIGGTGAKPRARREAAAGNGGTASAGEMPLANLSNLMMGSSRPRRDAPSIKELSTTTPRPRVAGEKQHTKSCSNDTSRPRGSSSSLHRMRSNASSPRDSSLSRMTSTTSSPRGSFLPKVRSNASSPRGYFQPRDTRNTSSPRDSSLRPDRSKTSSPSPRDSSLLISQPLRSTSTSCRRFALLSINDVDSFTHSPDANLGNTASRSCREKVTSIAQCRRLACDSVV